jgi:hypothetical protein
MSKEHRLRSLIVGVMALLVLSATAHGAVSQRIYAYFDVDGGLQFRYADSSNVGSTIPPGTYTLNLNNNGADDFGIDHIFHLTGPGVDYTAPNVDTTAVFSVTFQAGSTYRVFDDLNPKISQTILATTAPAPTTTSVLPATTPTSSSKPTSSGVVGSAVGPPVLATLQATVSTGGKLSLTRNGRPVKSLKHGRYAFAVNDRSRLAGFTVSAPHRRSVVISSVVYLGRRSVTVNLTAGRWSFSTPGGAKQSFTVVA